MLISAGIATAAPLLLFGIGAKKIPLSTIGLMQYITPTMQMTIAIFIAGEQLEPARWIGYVIIWVAVAVFAADIVLRHRRRRRERRVTRLAEEADAAADSAAAARVTPRTDPEGGR